MNSDKKRSPSKPLIASMSETQFLTRLRKRSAKRTPYANADDHLVAGIGDDAAVLHQDNRTDLVISADLLIENVDFRLRWTNARMLGYKALAVSLSDLAAMGATPRWAMVSIGLPRRLWDGGFPADFYDGWFELAGRTGVQLIGGDISRTPRDVALDSIALGETIRGQAIQRSGARPGDRVFVTGALGGAAGGLKLLERRRRPAKKEPTAKTKARNYLIARQQQPEPRTQWGRYLGELQLATAMIDLSDGLSSDLHHLCRESGVGAALRADVLPIDPNLAPAGFDETTALEHALNGGEDLELLFTVSPKSLANLPQVIEGVAATMIGEITGRAGRITIDSGNGPKELKALGFEHFR